MKRAMLQKQVSYAERRYAERRYAECRCAPKSLPQLEVAVNLRLNFLMKSFPKACTIKLFSTVINCLLQ
jgi:hypothetical protein